MILLAHEVFVGSCICASGQRFLKLGIEADTEMSPTGCCVGLCGRFTVDGKCGVRVDL